MSLSDFDHPFLFLVAMTIGVFAMAKVLAYFSGKIGLTVMQEFFAPTTA